jgi:hypothetical protein
MILRKRAASVSVRISWEHMFVTDPSPLRRCGRCKERKPLHEFAWRRQALGQRDNYCRPCRAAYKRAHYTANRQRYLDAADRRKRRIAAERAALLVAVLRDRPCVDCGERDPLVLEFDHLRDKSFNIAHSLRNRSWQAVLAEIEKCEVVCANCHRRRTARTLGFARAAVAQR